MTCEQIRELYFRTKDPSSDLGIANFGVYVPWIFSPETCLVFMSFDDPWCSMPSKQPRSIVNEFRWFVSRESG